MDTIHSRIAWLVENNGKATTKTAFAKAINISQPHFSQICSGARNPSDRTIADISRVFHVNRKWLETGEGDIEMPTIDTDLTIINNLLADTTSPTADLIRNIWRTYCQLPPEDQKILDNFIAALLKQK